MKCVGHPTDAWSAKVKTTDRCGDGIAFGKEGGTK